MPETKCLYFDHLREENPSENEYHFEGKVLQVFKNVMDNNKQNIVILDKTSFYPTSGGQQHDRGTLTIKEQTYDVINVTKVGKCVLHTLDKELPDDIENEKVKGKVDEKRRLQLKSHHTTAHIIFAACRRVLGPHIWQAGAKKTIKQGHLDITHYSSLSKEEEQKIEEEANRIVMQGNTIHKTLENKDEAELQHGFTLYQGGVIPGNTLRVVNIEGVDVEACCGTHCDNTSEVGWIKVINSERKADGIVRIYFVARERALEVLQQESTILNDLIQLWNVPPDMLHSKASQFFREWKK